MEKRCAYIGSRGLGLATRGPVNIAVYVMYSELEYRVRLQLCVIQVAVAKHTTICSLQIDLRSQLVKR